jgi:hypothetical protein
MWGSGGIAPSFLTSELDEGECSASRAGRFIPGEKRSQDPWDMWLGQPQNESGCHGEGEILFLLGTESYSLSLHWHNVWGRFSWSQQRHGRGNCGQEKRSAAGPQPMGEDATLHIPTVLTLGGWGCKFAQTADWQSNPKHSEWVQDNRTMSSFCCV